MTVTHDDQSHDYHQLERLYMELSFDHLKQLRPSNQTKNITAKITRLLSAGSQMQQVRGDGGSEARPLPNSCKQQHQGLP